MTPGERRQYVVEFDFYHLLMTDPKLRAEIDAKEISSGIRTSNEIRKKRGLPPKDGGDSLVVNGGYLRLEQVGKETNNQG